MNGKERNLSQFRKLSAYIMQDNQLHGNLTVEEAMTVATNLKLSTKVDKNGKIDVVSSPFDYINVYSAVKFECIKNVYLYYPAPQQSLLKRYREIKKDIGPNPKL